MSTAVSVARALLGRRLLWRLGRTLYMGARLDVPNHITSNGERQVQAAVLATYGQARPLVAFDIGAHVGDWAQSLLDQADRRGLTQVDLHAFEPVSETFEVLSHRLRRPGRLGNLHLARTAVSSAQGEAQINVYGALGGTNSLHGDSLLPPAARVWVETTTVDAYCQAHAIKTIHLLKSDTEGHDMEVIRGASRLFDEERIMVCQFEYNHRWVLARHYLRDVFEFAVKRPYRVAKLTPGRVEVYPQWHPEIERFFESNWLLLHETALEGFSARPGLFDGFNTFVAG